MFTDFFFYRFLFVLKEMFNQLSNREGLIDMFWTRHNCQKHRIDQKTMSKPFFSLCWVGMMAMCCFPRRSHIYSSSGMVICPLHACPAQQGSPGRTNPHRQEWTSPTVPLSLPIPSPALFAFSCPTIPLPVCPASLPYDLVADKTRGPAVPSAWCQHFPLIQSQSCCVTDGVGDQKQQHNSIALLTLWPSLWSRLKYLSKYLMYCMGFCTVVHGSQWIYLWWYHNMFLQQHHDIHIFGFKWNVLPVIRWFLMF